MSTWRAFVETVHLTALGLWAGTLLAVGGAAGLVFRVARELNPQLPGYAAWQDQHWRIVGGSVNQALFLVADVVQLGASLVAVLTLVAGVLLLGVPVRRTGTVVRVLALSVALACAAGLILIVTPSMNTAFRASWAAAQAGNVELAATHKARGDELHPIARNLYVGGFVSVLIALIAGLWSNTRAWTGGPPGAPVSRYPEPALLRGGRG